MNFDHMPELDWRLGYPFALGLMLAVSVVAVRRVQAPRLDLSGAGDPTRAAVRRIGSRPVTSGSFLPGGSMKIGVCVKEVPDVGPSRRIDPATMRMDRSGDRSLNAFDLQAVEAALRLKADAGEGEVVLVSMGQSRALESLRKGLAMGADRAVLVSDYAAAGSGPGRDQLA